MLLKQFFKYLLFATPPTTEIEIFFLLPTLLIALSNFDIKIFDMHFWKDAEIFF